jgi:hypothetical protein
MVSDGLTTYSVSNLIRKLSGRVASMFLNLLKDVLESPWLK